MAEVQGGDATDASTDQLFLPATGSSTLPLWLSPSRFLAADFEPEACVASLRRYVPLATLQTELQTYVGQLKTKLVEVINEDYGDYIGLSSKLATVDGAVLRMRKPLVELKDKLNVVQESVKSELAALNQGLKRRKEVATARSLLELLQEVAHVASKVEKLLAEVVASDGPAPPGAAVTSPSASSAAAAAAAAAAASADADGGGAGGGGGTADLDGRSRLLERVAGEVSRLTFLANRGKDLAFLRQLEPRVAASRRELGTRLSSCLAAALASRRPAAVLHCLRACAELGDVAPAEAAVRERAVAPAVERALAEHRARFPRAGEALPVLFTSLLTAIQEELGPVLKQVLAPQSGLRAFDLLGNAVLAEVQRSLAENMNSIFSPGVPHTFHANYRAALGFLDALEALCVGRGAVERLRSSAAYTAFLRRWNLSVYFSLLFQDIAGELEDAARIDRLEPAAAAAAAAAPAASSAAGPTPRLAVGAALLRCLSRSVQPDVFLPQLSDRMLRLALQCCGRYASWTAAVALARREPPVGGTGADGTPCALSWVAGLPGDELVVLYQDADSLAHYVEGRYSEAFMAAAGGGGTAASGTGALDPAAREALQGALRQAALGVRERGQELLHTLAEEVVEQCVGVVRQLKGITATYRMTTKGPPTRHSHYVQGVLTPLRTLLEAPHTRTLEGGAVRALALSVVESVSGRYQALAEELLSTVRKTELSLRRLKKNRPGEADGGAPGDGMLDSDKICLQLFLDVQEFGAQAGRMPGLSHPLPDMPAYQALLAAVTPADQLPGAAPAAAAAAPAAM